jgi:hypothetical protein
VPDLLLHEHAALQRGPRHLVLLLRGAVLGVEMAKDVIAIARAERRGNRTFPPGEA